MKKFLILLTLMAFMVAAPLCLTAAEKEINCCYGPGTCSEMTKAECSKKKGKVVKDCRQCEAPTMGGPMQEPGRAR